MKIWKGGGGGGGGGGGEGVCVRVERELVLGSRFERSFLVCTSIFGFFDRPEQIM